MQNGKNNGVGFFGLAVSSWSNSQRGPGRKYRNQNRVVKNHYLGAINFSPGKFGEDLCTQSCTNLGAN